MQHSYFFNSIEGDRLYDATDFAAFFSGLLTNGVFPLPGNGLQVMANGDMTITVNPGKAWINGHVYTNDLNVSILTLACDAADTLLDRIDRVVIRFSTSERAIVAALKKGTPASSPTPPALQRDSAGIYELGIADILVTHGVTTITQTLITDLRMNSVHCGWVNSLIQADTTSIFNQYQAWYTSKKNVYDSDFATWSAAQQAAYAAWYQNLTTTEQNQIDQLEIAFQTDWNTWFATVKDALDGSTAGNLLAQITAVPKIYRGSTAPAAPRSIDFWFKEV